MGRKSPPARPASRPGKPRRWSVIVPVVVLATLAAAEGGLRLTAFFMGRSDPFWKRGAAGAKVIYCVGDSFTWGYGVKREQSWPSLIQRMIDTASVTKRADVNNLGFPGLSSTNAVFAVAQAIKQEDAGVILLMAGWNANDSDFIEHAREKSQSVPVGVRIEALLDHSRLYKVAKQALTYRSRTAVLDQVELTPQANMEFYDFRAYQEIAYENLRKAVRLSRDFGVPLYLLNYPYRDLPPNEYSKNEYYHVLYGRTKITDADYILPGRRPGEIAIHAVIRRVGEEESVPVIDFQEAFVQSGEPPDVLFQHDYHHPTVIGHLLMARTIMRSIGRDLVKLVDAPAPPKPGE